MSGVKENTTFNIYYLWRRGVGEWSKKGSEMGQKVVGEVLESGRIWVGNGSEMARRESEKGFDRVRRWVEKWSEMNQKLLKRDSYRGYNN